MSVNKLPIPTSCKHRNVIVTLPVCSFSFQYIFLMILVFLLETTVGSMSYIYDTQVGAELNRTLNDTFLMSYGVHKARTMAIDQMQQDYKCCGAVRFEDWKQSVWIRSRRKDLIMPPLGRSVPDSCCFTQTELCGKRDHPSNIPYTVKYLLNNNNCTKLILLFVSAGLHLSNDGRYQGTPKHNWSHWTRCMWDRSLWTDLVLCLVYKT